VVLTVAAWIVAPSAMAAAPSAVGRITFAANCANPEIPACETEPFGVRNTVELHADGTATVRGAASRHSYEPGGVGSGQPLGGEIPYTVTTGPAGLTIGDDPNDRYYNLDVGLGLLSFPVSSGHFNAHFIAGVQIESTVITY
jgi:hypothetical protein